MALNFPASPSTGDVHNASNGLQYHFDGVKWVSQGAYNTSTINTLNFTQQGTGALSRSVQNKLEDVVSVLDYIPQTEHAAIRAGTSTYDATANIQSALSNGKTIYFPNGKYICASGVSITEVGTKLYGEANEKGVADVSKGTGTIIEFTGSAGLTSIATNKIEFRDMTIRSSTGFSSQYLIKFDAVYSCIFSNMIIQNNGSHASATALFMDDDDSDASTLDYAWNNFFDNCLFSCGSNKGHTIDFQGSDSFFNNIYSSGGAGIRTKPGGNNWSNIHTERAYSSGSSGSSSGTYAGFTVFETGYTDGKEGIINVSNLYADIHDIGVKWDVDGTGAYLSKFNFNNVVTRNCANCDFLFESSGSSTPTASGGNITNYQTKGTATTPIKTSGTFTGVIIYGNGTFKKLNTDIANFGRDLNLECGTYGGNSSNGATNVQAYFGFNQSSSNNFAGVILGAGPNGNQPSIYAGKGLNSSVAHSLFLRTNGTERLSIQGSDGRIKSIPTYDSTAVDSANISVNSNGFFRRHSSSLDYKKNIETIQDSYADKILETRPVWFKAKNVSDGDNPNWGYWGFIAEEVATIDPRLVSYSLTENTINSDGDYVITTRETPKPEGVHYTAFIPHLVNLIKRQKTEIENLKTRVTKLEG